MEKCIESLLVYFENELPKIKESYNWRIPTIEGFHLCGKKDYYSNIELKKYFNKKWLNSNVEEKLTLSKIVVSDWGGVKNNNDETLRSYVNELGNPPPSTPLKGVASYSKIFSIADMSKYAIYDARVAVCLNAVQYNFKLKKGIAFNYIDGRNNITGHSGKKIGFTYLDPFKTKTLVENGWEKIEKDDTYAIYLGVLKECLKALPKYDLHDLEMVLFANAEIECNKATLTQ